MEGMGGGVKCYTKHLRTLITMAPAIVGHRGDLIILLELCTLHSFMSCGWGGDGGRGWEGGDGKRRGVGCEEGEMGKG